jgi:hypothetical protein
MIRHWLLNRMTARSDFMIAIGDVVNNSRDANWKGGLQVSVGDG